MSNNGDRACGAEEKTNTESTRSFSLGSLLVVLRWLKIIEGIRGSILLAGWAKIQIAVLFVSCKIFSAGSGCNEGEVLSGGAIVHVLLTKIYHFFGKVETSQVGLLVVGELTLQKPMIGAVELLPFHLAIL